MTVLHLTLTFFSALTLAAASDPAIDRIDKIFESIATPGSPGCAVGVLQNGQTTLAKGYGLADIEQNIRLTPQSRFYMASVSKHFTAMAALLAEREGKLRLDDPVTNYIPEMPAYAKAITLRRMLDHTAGLRDYLALWSLKGWSTNSVLREPPTLALITRQKALDFAAGADHSYSNSGYFLMSLVIERAAGERLNDYLQKRLFQPLGMTATRFQHDHSDPLPSRAHGHLQTDGLWKIHDTAFDLVGSGGLYSNIDDMLKWARNFEEPKVATGLVEKLSVPAPLTGGRPIPNGYALGLRRMVEDGLVSYWHAGGALGYRTFFSHWPEQKLTVITLCNRGENTEHLTRRVAAALMSKPEPKVPAPPKDPSASLSPADAIGKMNGAYWSDELEAVWRIVDFRGKMLLDNDGGHIPVLGSASDGYRAGPATFKPRLGGNGEVTGLEVSTGRARGILFVRR